MSFVRGIASLLITAAGFFSSSASADYIRHEAKFRDVIIFVHGVTGNAFTTWANTQSNAYWPDLLKDDTAFTGANIYAYDFPTPNLSHAPSISELADHMKLRFDSDDVLRHDRVTFVAHSMGGIVTRAFILRYRDHISASKIRLLYLFAVPTNGSGFAKMMTLGSRNPQFKTLQRTDADAFLSTLSQDWVAAHQTLSSIRSFCAYEISEQIVVDRQSATALCNQTTIGINADHKDIVKPKDRQADAYRALKVAYQETTPKNERTAPEKPSQLTVKQDPSCQRSKLLEFLTNQGVFGSRPAQAAGYEQKVTYYDRGVVGSSWVISEARKYELAWPERVYEIIDKTVKVGHLRDDRCLIMFQFKFSLTNSARTRCGVRHVLYVLANKDGIYKVVAEDGHGVENKTFNEDCAEQ